MSIVVIEMIIIMVNNCCSPTRNNLTQHPLPIITPIMRRYVWFIVKKLHRLPRELLIVFYPRRFDILFSKILGRFKDARIVETGNFLAVALALGVLLGGQDLIIGQYELFACRQWHCTQG